jgi:hypothetical protein
MVSEALPVLVKVTVWAALVVFSACPAKVNEVGEKVAIGAAAVPVPVRATVCGLPAALSATAREALRAPVAEGVKVTLMVQLAPAANVVAQVWV